MPQNGSTTTTQKPDLSESQKTQRHSSVAMGKGRGLRTVELLGRLLLSVILRFWRLCATAALMLLLAFWMHGGVLTLFLLILSLMGLFYNAQDMLLYYPDQPPQSRLYVEMPSTVDLPYHSQFVRTRDGVRINVVLIKHKVNAPTIVYFHGNAGNIGHRLMNCQGLFALCGCNILLVEYRGYGKSEGSPSEYGLYKDAEAAMDFLLGRDDINHDKIVVFGRSLGGAVAVWLASQPYYANHITALVVENTFVSLPEIGRNIFEFKVLDYLPDIFFKHKYRSVDKIKNIKMPTLFLSGMADQLIPPKMMATLHNVSGSSMKRLHRFEQGTHNETWMCNGYYEALSHFLRDVMQARANGELSHHLNSNRTSNV